MMQLYFEEVDVTLTQTYQSLEAPRQTRPHREYTLHLLGKEYRVGSCREAMKTTLLKLEKPGFFDEVYKRRTKMRRCHLVAHTPEELFPNSRDNARKYAHRLNSEWFYRSLMDVEYCNRHLECIASVAGIKLTPWVEEISG